MSNATILVIEDDEFQQELLRLWLEAEQYTVKIANNGEQALTFIAEKKPDLILLDLLMPTLDGFATARQLKENSETRTIPIVVVTVIDAHDKRITALEIGVDDFLNKPVDRLELLVRVKNLLQSRAYFKQLQDRQAHLFQLENLASLGTLITSVSHALHTPIAELKEIIEVIRDQVNINNLEKHLLKNAEQAVERIDLISNNMQLYIKSISQTQLSETSSVNKVLKEVLDLLARQMEEANIKVETQVSDELPLVQCSAEGLMHVLVHVLLNARDGLLNYSQTRRLLITAQIQTQQLIISVCDNNTEQTENMYTLITDPLFTTRLPDVCEGLGLALACHVIEQQGGSISIDSIIGKGCCMRVVLKIAEN